MIKILIVTHSAVSYTGLAEITRNIFMPLLEKRPQKYKLLQIGLLHRTAVRSVPWEIVPTLSKFDFEGNLVFLKDDLMGQLTMAKVVVEYQPDIIFAFNEPQHLLQFLNPSLRGRAKLVLYVTLDGWPAPRCARELASADLLVTPSHFSRSALVASLKNPEAKVEVAYAPADTNRFRPVSPNLKLEMRRDICPDWIKPSSFILGWVGTNRWRKQMWLMFPLIKLLRTGDYLTCDSCGRSRGKSQALHWCPCGAREAQRAAPLADAVLWLHLPTGPSGGDWPRGDLESMYGVKVGEDVYYTECSEDAHLRTEDMPKLYQMWDCLLMLSGGESCAVPAIEAMSCELPIVCTDYSAQAEVVRLGCAGLTVTGFMQPEAKTCILRCIADLFDALDRIRQLYFNHGQATALGKNGRRFALRHDTHTYVDYWDSAFSKLCGFDK